MTTWVYPHWIVEVTTDGETDTLFAASTFEAAFDFAEAALTVAGVPWEIVKVTHDAACNAYERD